MTASRAAATKPFGTAKRGFAATSRRDRWWVEPVVVAVGFTAFIVYSLFSALVWQPVFGVPYEADGYLSPFFSPLLFAGSLPWWFSPAILILWIPLGFRTLYCFSCSRATRTRYGLWRRLTSLNTVHMRWAWASLVSVALADLYVRLLAIGLFQDPAIRL